MNQVSIPRLLLLGPLDIRGADGRTAATLLNSSKRLALLCYLAARPSGAFAARQALLSVFWPEADDARARNALRNTLHYLRSQLGADALVTRAADELALDPNAVWCDVVGFERARADGAHERALGLYRGRLLEGFSPGGLPGFDDWLDRRRRELEGAAADSARELTERASETSAADAVRWAERWVELSPFEEPAIRALMHVLSRAGDRAGALGAFEEWRERVERELGGAPSPNTLGMAEAIRAARPAPSPPRPPRPQTSPATGPVTAPIPRPLADTPKRRRAPVLAAGAVLVVLVAGAGLRLGASGERAAASGPPTVAVLPFSYAGTDRYDYLSSGMVELIGDLVAASPSVRGVDSRAVLTATLQHDVLHEANGREIARRLGASHYILGSMLELEGGLHVNASLYDVRRSGPVARSSGRRDLGTVFELADQLGAELLSAGIGAGAVPARRVLSTASLAAMHAYLDGERAYVAGRYDAAMDHFYRAIEEDSTFARAALSLSMAANWVGRWNTVLEALALAHRHRGRLNPVDDGMIAAWTAQVGHPLYRSLDAHTADSLWRAVLDAQPSNAEAWFQWGDLRYHWGPVLGVPNHETSAPFERALELLPSHAGALIHLVRTQTRADRPESVDRLVDRLRERGARSRELSEGLVLRAIAHGDTAALPALLAGMSRHFDAPPYHMLPGHAPRPELLVGPLKAHTWLRRDHRIRLYTILAYMAAGAGRTEDQEAELRALGDIAPGRAVEAAAVIAARPFAPVDTAALLALRAAIPGHVGEEDTQIPGALATLLDGLLALRLGDAAAAAAAAAELEGHPPDGAFGDRPLAASRMLRARIALAGGDPGAAIEAVGRRRTVHSRRPPDYRDVGLAFERWTRAEALEALGETEEAFRWYATFPEPAGSDLAFTPAARQRAAPLGR